jgi:hypothetical protein
MTAAAPACSAKSEPAAEAAADIVAAVKAVFAVPDDRID